MVRVIAFASGIAAAAALLLFVLGAVSFSSPPPVHVTRTITLDVQQGTGMVTGHDSSGSSSSVADDNDPDDGTQVDLQGDEITPAVATYKFDSQGQIYETHAPRTEVPRLGSPIL